MNIPIKMDEFPLKFEPPKNLEAESGLFLLKTTTAEHLQQLRAAITLLTRIQRRRCRMDVLAVAPRHCGSGGFSDVFLGVKRKPW